MTLFKASALIWRDTRRGSRQISITFNPNDDVFLGILRDLYEDAKSKFPHLDLGNSINILSLSFSAQAYKDDSKTKKSEVDELYDYLHDYLKKSGWKRLETARMSWTSVSTEYEKTFDKERLVEELAQIEKARGREYDELQFVWRGSGLITFSAEGRNLEKERWICNDLRDSFHKRFPNIKTREVDRSITECYESDNSKEEYREFCQRADEWFIDYCERNGYKPVPTYAYGTDVRVNGYAPAYERLLRRMAGKGQ